MISPWPKVEGVSYRKSNTVIFNIVPSYINTLSSSVMEQMDPFCVEGTIMVPQKVVHSIHKIIICGKMMTTMLLFHFREEVIVRGSQIRRIGWVFDKLESTFIDSSYGTVSTALIVASFPVGSDGPRSPP